MKYQTLLLAAAAAFYTASWRSAVAGGVGDSNVVWTSPSTDSNGSMPLGNGDIGVNVWTENGRDLVFYLSKTDAWNGNGDLLKLGKVRVTLPEGTFSSGGPFRQEFRLQDGTIQIDAGTGSAATTIKLWADPNHPVVQVDVQRSAAFNTSVSIEPWRPQTQEVARGSSLVWYDRNETSIWADNLTKTGLDPNNTASADPLIHNTFGAAITGTNLASINSTTMQTTQATAHEVISVHALTKQTATAQDWINQLDQQIATTQSVPYDQRKAANDQWWSNFNQQSYLRVTGGPGAADVTRGYAIQRAMNAFAGRGNSPIKFNGSIFNVDTFNRPDFGDRAGQNADFRSWGGAYWFQNTRLAYWSMLSSGDFQQMQPFFDMYVKNLGVAKERTQTYYAQAGTRGAFFPETMTTWGTYTLDDYGYNNPNPTSGQPSNQYVQYYWQGGIELSAMMLQYYDYTRDQQFARTKLLPLASEIVTFYDTHYGRDASGKLSITPAHSLENWWDATNPLPEIAGLSYVLDKLLALPTSETTAQQREQWARLKSELPALPTRNWYGSNVYSPAETFDPTGHNVENPELYAVFPYLISGVGKSNLQLGIETFKMRQNSAINFGWAQDPIQAAMLGIVNDYNFNGDTLMGAQSMVTQRFQTPDPGSRFPGFYGPNFDWVPDQDHANVASTALQRMLLQVDGDHVEFFPAWPTNWDVEFRQFGPMQMIFMGRYKDGDVQWMDPTADGFLTGADYQLVLAHLGYDNYLSKGDLASLLSGDVNFDGQVTDLDRLALLAGAAELGVDTSNWVLVPEPATLIMLATASVLLALRRRRAAQTQQGLGQTDC